jgi:small subunit ribosomal protein S16
MRVGKKKQPTYRVVVADSHSPRDGRFIEILGQYEPRKEPSVVNIDTDKALAWIEKGAQPTEQAAKLLAIAGVWDGYRTKHNKDAAARPKPKTPKAASAPSSSASSSA